MCYKSQTSGSGVNPVPPFVGVLLCTDFPFVLKQRADQVDLHCRYHHHNNEVDHRPKVHPVKVTLLEVPVTSLKRPQQRLDLHTFAQSTLHVVDGILKEMRHAGEAA